MAPNVECSTKTSSKSKLLTMDVVELTLLLKSIGFRLESIDYDEFRCWNKKSVENGNSAVGASAANASRTDIDQNYINVEISCSKSKIVSNLSLKLEEFDPSVTTDAQTASNPAQTIACTCPKREPRHDNSSFWEVQSSGSFANPKRLSMNTLMGSEKTIDHDTSSNLLPVLSTKSIALTHVLAQVLLNQYKSNTQFGEISGVKGVDIKSIMRSIENTNPIPTLTNGKDGAMPFVGQIEELNILTPVSSMNVTPTEQEVLMNITMPKDEMTGRNAALNETVNTEAFSSPRSDLFTSSPHSNNSIGQIQERDARIINNLNAARKSIDHALLSMKLNNDRNLTHELPASSLLTTSILQSQYDSNRNHSIVPPMRRLSTGPSALQVSSNVRPPLSTLNRRASLGNIGKVASNTIVSRLSMPAAKNIDRPASVGSRIAVTTTTAAISTSKLSLVRRAVSGIGNRTIGSLTTSVKTPNSTTTSLKRPPSISRRTSSVSTTSNGTPSTPTTTLAGRKSTLTAETSIIPSKLAKK